MRAKIWLFNACLLVMTGLYMPAQGTSASAKPQSTDIPAPARHSIAMSKTLELGRKDADIWLSGDVTTLWPLMNGKMQDTFKSAETLKVMQAQLATTFGKLQDVAGEYTLPAMPDFAIYLRRISFTTANGRFLQTITFDSEGKIAGIFIAAEKNPAESQFLGYTTKTPLMLPFTGEWFVYQGGRSVGENYHAEFGSQRFAYDITVVRNDSLWKDDPTKLESFYAYGQPVLAPGDGKVVQADDLYEDSPIMKPSNRVAAYGNNIVIDHGNGEFSFIAHLKFRSVQVKIGDTVKAGQQIAQCGNSGNSPFPHIHYHMQNTSSWAKGDGLPTQFPNIVINGKNASGEPVKAQYIRNK